MNIVQSWKDSLDVLKPKKLKLFLLVTLKTIQESYCLLLKYFWWLPLLAIVSYSFSFDKMPFILIYLWILVCVLCARPSVRLKNADYFIGYIFHIPGFIIFFVIWVVFTTLTLVFIAGPPMIEPPIQKELVEIGITRAFFVQLFLCMFFMFDMSVSIRNWARAISYSWKIILFNLPIFTLFIALYGLLFFTWTYFEKHFCLHGCPLLEVGFTYLIIPILISVISNLFIKSLHEQPQLYFKEPSNEEKK